jgi:hypothetical protein
LTKRGNCDFNSLPLAERSDFSTVFTDNTWEGLSVKRLILFCLATALSIALGAQRAEAGFLLPFTGNTFPSNLAPGAVDGHVEFTVLDHTGGTPGDSFGTGLPGFDGFFVPGAGSGAFSTASKFLYLFQTVNDGVNANGISNNTVQLSGPITSFGAFLSTTFTQFGAPAGGPANYLGAFGASAPPGVAGVSSGHSATGPPQAPGAAISVTTDFPLLVFPASGSLQANFALVTGLIAGHESVLWGYTSDLAPSFGNTGITDHGSVANGSVPTNVPEPASLVLAAFGALGFVGYARRKRASV